MSILKRTQIANIHQEEILINRKNQETIMMQQELITALRNSYQKLEDSYRKLKESNKQQEKKSKGFQEKIKDLQQHNTILSKMIEQQQQLINKQKTF